MGKFPTLQRELNGEDPKAFVISANIHRRHMTKGQQAMAVAMIYPDPEKGGRGKKAPTSGEVPSQRIADARAVLAYSLELAEAAKLSSRRP